MMVWLFKYKFYQDIAKHTYKNKSKYIKGSYDTFIYGDNRRYIPLPIQNNQKNIGFIYEKMSGN